MIKRWAAGRKQQPVIGLREHGAMAPTLNLGWLRL
jgi:hypothetical protein